MESKVVAIIGAGVSGITSIRQALQYGVKPVCFEASGSCCGLWNYKPYDTDESSVMKGTVINTSKEMTAFSDFPPPDNFANFMHNKEVLKYLELYIENFNLKPFIKFNHRVTNIRRADDYAQSGCWRIAYTNAEGVAKEETFDGVLVCTGHHTIPLMPTPPFPGQDEFQNDMLHSHSYKDPQGYEDKTVLVVGVGNSGGDIAVELSRIADKVYLSTRRGAWIWNRVYDYGVPYDVALFCRFYMLVGKYLSIDLLSWFVERRLNKRFDHTVYGIKPDHKPLSAHGTVNDELPCRIACGTVVIKPNIKMFTKTGATFDDDSTVEHIDKVIFATGFKFGFPLLEGGKLVPVKDNMVSLYKYMYPPDLSDKNTLGIIGLIQPVGSIMPIAELQARVFFDVFTKNTVLPSESEMNQEIEHKKKVMEKRYVKSHRHTIQVDFVEFMDELAALIGSKPNLLKYLITDPVLAYRLLLGPNLPYVYRLSGPKAWSGARDAIVNVWKRIESSFD